MKKLFLWVVLLTFCPFVWAQNLQVTQNSYQKVAISFETGALSVEDISIPEGVFSMISLPGYAYSYNPGSPQLPQLTKLIQTPVCDSVVARVVAAEYTDYDAAALGVQHPLFPSQASVSKAEVNPPFTYNASVYQSDAFFHHPLVKVEKAGVKRNVALANLYFSPVQYNPVQQKIRIYSHVDVEVTFVNANMARTVELQKYASPMFSLDRSMVVNKMQETRNEYSTSPIKYLIVANPMFADNAELAAFVSWKRRLGYLVEVAYTGGANVGTTTTAIKSFIQSRYDAATPADPAPTFLLLIGDREQLPAFTGVADNDHITDLYYATLSGGDNLPDLYYGRMSATNNTELSNQIEKILMYEQYTMPDPSYLGNAVLIAGTDSYWAPTHANGQVNYINNNYINLDNPRYSNVMAHLYNCSSEAALIRSEVSAGTGWVNYTAHGSETSWADPSFTTSHVAQLQNEGKYGLMIGNCCQSGNFKTSECFGEALLRAQHKGAMGYIGASNNSYWGEDFYWAVGFRSNINANPSYMASNLGMYDKLFHTHNEDYSVWVSTIGGMITGGNMAVQSTSSDLKLYYWEIYHCFGDPSVRAYLGVPSTMTVNASDVVLTSSTSYDVTVAPYAYVALTQGETIIDAAFADENGSATLSIGNLDPGQYELTAQAQNYVPFFKDVLVITPSGPYVVPTVVETAPNTVFNLGATVNINLSLSNVGVDAASQVYATLTSDDGIPMLQDSVFVGVINADATESRANAFSFVMPESEDYVALPFTLRIHWQDTILVRSVTVRVLLPKVQLDSYTTSINNAEVQNYKPGDQLLFTFSNKNIGHVAVGSGSVDLTCNYSGVQVMSEAAGINGLEPNTYISRYFTVKIADTVPEKSLVPLYYHTSYDGIYHIDTLLLLVGADFVSFEDGSFGDYGFTMNNYPWIVASTGAHSGTYCARSAQNLPSSSKSRMTVTITSDVDAEISFYRKVSSEAGYDKFIFSVDGIEVDNASGEVDWTYYSAPVEAGTHSFRFSYEKDYSQVSGHDCAWVDDIMLPCVGVLVIEDMADTVGVGVPAYVVTRATVYPNPANDRVVVESETPVQKAVLFDLNGRAVRIANVNGSGRFDLEVSDLTSGFYLLQLTFDNGKTQNLKIIKR